MTFSDKQVEAAVVAFLDATELGPGPMGGWVPGPGRWDRTRRGLVAALATLETPVGEGDGEREDHAAEAAARFIVENAEDFGLDAEAVSEVADMAAAAVLAALRKGGPAEGYVTVKLRYFGDGECDDCGGSPIVMPFDDGGEWCAQCALDDLTKRIDAPAPAPSEPGEGGEAAEDLTERLNALRDKLATRSREHGGYADEYAISDRARSHSQSMAASALAWAVQGIDDVLTFAPSPSTAKAGAGMSPRKDVDAKRTRDERWHRLWPLADPTYLNRPAVEPAEANDASGPKPLKNDPPNNVRQWANKRLAFGQIPADNSPSFGPTPVQEEQS